MSRSDNTKLFVEEADELLNGYTEEPLRNMQKAVHNRLNLNAEGESAKINGGK